MHPTIYLAGPVGHSPDAPSEWRETVAEAHADRFHFRDPLSKYNLAVDELTLVDGRSDPDVEHTVGIDEIVETDKELIDDSDALLVGYTDVQQIGTPMEVMYAYERDYPIVVWIRDDTRIDDLSPWYRYHATAITNDLTLALNHIEGATDADDAKATAGGDGS